MELLKEKKKVSNADYFKVTKGVWGMRVMFVNLYIIQDQVTDKWVLIDAGLKGFDKSIIKMAEDLFGEGTKPEGIVLTHGHFDHTGALEELLEHWDVPVFASKLEIPFLNGTSDYPPADPTAGGGMMAWMSWSYPTDPIDISDHLQVISEEGSLEILNGWDVIFTPGHSPGHISLLRKEDKTLIAGDAFVTTQAESAISTMQQKKKICGPPRYLTPDWPAAHDSVKKLAALKPEVVATGHGRPLQGKAVREDLQDLADNFYTKAVPEHGRYVNEPIQSNEMGVYYIPPLNTSLLIKIGVSVAIGAVASFFLIRLLNKK